MHISWQKSVFCNFGFEDNAKTLLRKRPDWAQKNNFEVNSSSRKIVIDKN
jgi:hypothetical protein